MKAFAYLRVSGQSQVAGDGFPRQLAAIKAYAAANNIKIEHVYREQGVSGTVENMNRPAWGALIGALHSGPVRTILIERLDRLARDLMVQERTIADLRRNGFELVSTAEPDLMADDPTRKLMRQIMGGLAEYDKSQIVLKLAASRARIRARGERCDGRKPYGHHVGEAAILDRLRALRANGLGFDRIAATLNAEGVQTRTGKPWHGVVVNRILARSKTTS
jgi:DNA invertase Pin-like site-specific DNA recombinase